MDELQELKDKVSKIEYIELKGVKDDVNAIKIDLASEKILTQQNIISSEKLTNAIESIKDTMVELTNTVKENGFATSELSKNVNALNEKVNKIESKLDSKVNDLNGRINTVDNKGKLDWIEWVKNNIVGILMGIGGFVYFISQLMN